MESVCFRPLVCLSVQISLSEYLASCVLDAAFSRLLFVYWAVCGVSSVDLNVLAAVMKQGVTPPPPPLVSHTLIQPHLSADSRYLQI